MVKSLQNLTYICMLQVLDLRKVPELVSETYTHACRQSAADIQKYESLKSEIPQREASVSKEKLHEAQKLIDSDLSHAERGISDGCDGMEMISNWLGLLKSQSEFMEEVDKNEKSQIGQFMLSFTSTSQKLKNLETDIPEFLRKLIENEETPATIRLAQLWSKMELEYHNRCGILNDVENQLAIALQRLRKVTAENEELTAESRHYDEQLETFSGSESYKMIQNARRHDLLLEEWDKKRASILEQTDKAEEELKGYLDKEHGEAVITKQCAQNDAEYEKLSAKYADMMREVREEAGISAQNNQAILRALEQELASSRSQQLAKESSLTRNALRKAKIAGERKVQRHRSEATGEISALRQNLKKKTDVKSKRTRKGKAKEPQVDPETLVLERGTECVQAGHEATMGRIKRVFDQELDELKQILEAYLGCGNVSIDKEVEEIKRDHAKAVDLAQANLARLSQRSAERNLELAGVGAKLVTMEGLVDDYLKQWKDLDEEHTRLMKMSLDSQVESAEAKQLRAEIDVMDRFVEKASYIIDVLKKKLAFLVSDESFKYLRNGRRRRKSQSDVDLERRVDWSARPQAPEEPREEEEKVEPEPVVVSEPVVEEEEEEAHEEEEVHAEEEVVVSEEPAESPPEVVEEAAPMEVKSRDVVLDEGPMRPFRVALDYEEPRPVHPPQRIRTARSPRFEATTHRAHVGSRDLECRFPPRYFPIQPVTTRKALVQTWGATPYRETILFAVTPFCNGEVEDEVFVVDRKMKLSQSTNVTNTPGIKRRFIMKTPDAEENDASANIEQLSMRRHLADWRPGTRVRRSVPARRKPKSPKNSARASFRSERTETSFDAELDKLVNMPLYSSRKLPRI